MSKNTINNITVLPVLRKLLEPGFTVTLKITQGDMNVKYLYGRDLIFSCGVNDIYGFSSLEFNGAPIQRYSISANQNTGIWSLDQSK